MNYFIVIKNKIPKEQLDSIHKLNNDTWETDTFVCGYLELDFSETEDEIGDIVGDDDVFVIFGLEIDEETENEKLQDIFAGIKGNENIYDDREEEVRNWEEYNDGDNY